MSGQQFETGRVGAFNWMTVCALDQGLYGLLRIVPEIVVGHHVAITSFDSGPLKPSPEESQLGWQAMGEVLWTSLIADPDILPKGEFDEWYITNSVMDLSNREVFVNYYGWRLSPIDVDAEIQKDPRCNRLELETRAAWHSQMLDRFWSQIQTVNPISYVAEGCFLNLVTKDPMVFEKAVRWAATDGRTH